MEMAKKIFLETLKSVLDHSIYHYSFLLITLKVTELEKIYLSDMQVLKILCYHIHCR